MGTRKKTSFWPEGLATLLIAGWALTTTAAAQPPSPPTPPEAPSPPSPKALQTDALVEALVANGWTRRTLEDGSIILEKMAPKAPVPPTPPAPPQPPKTASGAPPQWNIPSIPAPSHEGMVDTPQMTYQYKVFPNPAANVPPVRFQAYPAPHQGGWSRPAWQNPPQGQWRRPQSQYYYQWQFRHR